MTPNQKITIQGWHNLMDREDCEPVIMLVIGSDRRSRMVASAALAHRLAQLGEKFSPEVAQIAASLVDAIEAQMKLPPLDDRPQELSDPDRN